MSGERLRIQVVWATRAVQDVVPLELPVGTGVGTAIAASGLLERYGIERETVRPGIRGRLVRDGTPLADGDRIDLCRSLVADPKEARRRRAGERPRQDKRAVPPA